MTNTDKILAEFDEKFEWTDFSGDIGTHILAKKTSSYATEETERNELRTFIASKINQAIAEERKRVVEIVNFIDDDFLADLSNDEKYPLEYCINSERKRIRTALSSLDKPDEQETL